jgi:hypothetical protein
MISVSSVSMMFSDIPEQLLCWREAPQASEKKKAAYCSSPWIGSIDERI